MALRLLASLGGADRRSELRHALAPSAGVPGRAANKMCFAGSTPKRGVERERLSASLKRHPDTNPESYGTRQDGHVAS